MIRVFSVFFLMLPASLAWAATPCGGDFGAFVQQMSRVAVSAGLSQTEADRFFAGTTQNGGALRADRAQGVFQRPFTEFARRVISADRLRVGAEMEARHDALLARIEREMGVPRGVLLAFWGLETDYGRNQGDFPTRDVLVTLAHDCRRPELFQTQVIAAAQLFQQGSFDPQSTRGAWAGEIGMVQVLPSEALRHGRDADGDGRVSLQTSTADALTTAAQMMRSLGWTPGEPWLQEVAVPPDLNWSESGLGKTASVSTWQGRGLTPRAGRFPQRSLQASLLLPQGHRGPAFLAYPNFTVLTEWNNSFIYATTAGYFATRLEGAPIFAPGDPQEGLGAEAMRRLQQALSARGHDVGGVDGILGARTRAAVQAEQARLGLPADGWPTAELLSRL